LFKSARDYLKSYWQRDALETKLELIETKKRPIEAVVTIYKNLEVDGSKLII
jgi:hypothetical protein